MTPKERYLLDQERLGFHADASQAQAVEHLQALYDRLLLPVKPPGLFDKFLRRRPGAVEGLYIWGGVGRGKTYLMDTFYDALPLDAKQRLHFHRFMKQIHEALQVLPKTPDPLPRVAAKVAEEVRVLCLDEFHVHDIGDAMLLAGFLEALFAEGVTLVTTSNIPPDQLYRNGLQRERFLPAIELIKKHTVELHLDGGRDYRAELLERSGTYHIATGPESEQILQKQYARLVAGAEGEQGPLEINHRQIATVARADDVVWFDFPAICATPRSAADYLEIARMFHTVLIADVPVLDEATDDVAKRFIHLIDALYDHHVKVILTAATAAADLYQGQRHAFTFQRTISRLQEMASERYLAEAHRS